MGTGIVTGGQPQGASSTATTYPFLVAEYLPLTLVDVMSADSTTITEKLSYAMQLLSALVYLGTRTPPVVHRDIKPANIFVKGHSCVLGDFGLLKLVDEEVEAERFKESAGVGMPFRYRTPDQVAYLRNQAPLTIASDVFQLGLVLGELFTGQNPSEPATTFTEPIRLRTPARVAGALGGRIDALIYDMLDMNSLRRPAAASLMDGWSRLFVEAVERSHALEGRAF